MRTLEDHIVNPVNDSLTIQVLDEPGAGGACHQYLVSGFGDTIKDGDTKIQIKNDLLIHFQEGSINVAGVNGITQEVLLAIVADRLRSFQAGPYACTENQTALLAVETALVVLKGRTQARMARGVEGTHTV